MKDSKVYIDLAISACKKVTEYIQGITESEFQTESKTQSAILMQLQVIGEMAKKLDEHTKSRIDVPWKMIIGLRNMISHAYFTLELNDIWIIATTDVPALEKKLKEYLRDEGTVYMPPSSENSPLMG